MLGLMQDWPLLIHRVIDYAALQHGARPVISRSVEGPMHTTTYAEVRQRSLQMSKRLVADGIRLGDRVATLAWNTWRHLEAWYGITGVGAIWGQDIERAQIYAKRLCAHLWVDSMRRRLQHSKGIHRTVVASPLVAEPAYRQRRDSVVRHLRKYCLGNTFQHEAVSIRDMAKDFG
jgi:hypothetical protein